MKQKKKEESKPLFEFDMLQTDDSTDDEDTAKKSHRPAPPAWSLREFLFKMRLEVKRLKM